MLKTTALLENLKNGITLAYHGISSRSQLPILLNLLIEAKNGNIIISSTDLEIGIKVKIPAKIEGEGAITVGAKTFLDLITSIEQEKVELNVNEKTLELKGKGIRTAFPTASAEDFPKLYEEKGEKQAEFEREELNKEISRVVFCAAQDLGRPALSGVLIKNEGAKGLTLVATDGYRLSLKQGFAQKQTQNTKNQALIIPARVIKELVNIRQTEEDIKLFISEKNNQVLFEAGEVELIGRIIDAEYPDYEKIIPQDFSTSAVFDKTEAQNAVKACSVFAREAANIVSMAIGKDKIIFSAKASSVGENEVEIEAKTEGEENEISFNARYLLDFFGNVDSEEIVFEMTGPLNPGVFRLQGDKSYLHLIMPIRIQD